MEAVLSQKNEHIALAHVFPHPKNYKIHSPKQIEQLQASLRRFGQVRSVVLQEQENGQYLTVAGHGVIAAAKGLSWDTIAADVLPASWSEIEIKGYLVADNQHAEAARDDEYILMELLREQQDAGLTLETLGLYEEALDDLYHKLTPPTLEELAQKYGDDPEEEDFWPVIKVKVSPEVKERYDAVAPKIRDDAQKMSHLITLAEQQRPEEEDTEPSSSYRVILILPKETYTRYMTLLESCAGETVEEQFAALLERVS